MLENSFSTEKNGKKIRRRDDNGWILYMKGRPSWDDIESLIYLITQFYRRFIHFNKCCCCSLLTGAVMTGIVSLTAYIMGFSLEVWWIVVAEEQLPIPAFLLCLIYLILSILSLTMLVGLRSQRTYLILSWISMVLILLFPEAGMVLFMALYHWNTNTNGILELILWTLRVIFNLYHNFLFSMTVYFSKDWWNGILNKSCYKLNSTVNSRPFYFK
ncbi:unnamed protein product [Lepeophtheirus salmonis]|uniref:(salmon louse) hypothetical protein n=1 Tax=Lepeophtheirus salmonis TaxID=72036 RepID=A0A7R8H8U1_LEPSM|nr:unnamed protein product [Lepeophtheirus salmonis]CAF2947782.1 unnamed protein product [Lepeophtheirus salmonis]